MDRFQHIIRFGIYSHLHYESYQVQTDMRTHKPIGVNFIIGSGTTYIDGLVEGKPQSFNVIYADKTTLFPLNFESYAFDLDHANKYDDP